jgi:ABC-2 type transport system permease protein
MLLVGASLMRMQVGTLVQYRLAALSGLSIGAFWSLIEITVLTVFYTHAGGGAAVNGLGLAQAISYVWIAQVLFALNGLGLNGDILGAINSGDVGLALCRPMDLYTHWFFQTAAGRLGSFCMRGVPLRLLARVLPAPVRLGAPASWQGAAMALLALLSAFWLATAYALLVTALRMNIAWGDGPMHMMLLLGNVLSGSYLPLPLWPDALQTLLRLQPFAGYLDTPARLYLGVLGAQEGFWAIALQWAWTAGFVGIGRWVMRARLRTLVVQGG